MNPGHDLVGGVTCAALHDGPQRSFALGAVGETRLYTKKKLQHSSFSGNDNLVELTECFLTDLNVEHLRLLVKTFGILGY